MANVTQQDYYRCPECGLSDRVEKASVVSKLNAPTRNPMAAESPWGCFWIGVALVCIAVPILDIAISGGINTVIPFSNCALAIVLLVIAITGMAIWAQQVAKARQAEVARHNTADAAAVDHAIGIWNQLYYCGRNDVVFIPGQPETCVPASQVRRLYESL